MNYLINILVLIIILIIFFIVNHYNSFIFNFILFENFSSYTNPFYKNKSFCTFDKDLNKCKCTYQHDNMHIPYNAPETACNNKCINIKNPQECIGKNNEIDYYCKIDGKCKLYKGTNQSKYISLNNCGVDKLSNQIILPYLSKEDCESSLNVCDSFNKSEYSESEKKEKCLKNTQCGFCENKFSEGKCVQGTAEGPLDLNNNCSVNSTNSQNKYSYGDFLFSGIKKF